MFNLFRAFISLGRLRCIGLPQRALVIRLVDFTNARLIHEVPVRTDLQIVFGDDVQDVASCDGNGEKYVSEGKSMLGARGLL